MNAQKCGEFIAELRKEQNLTQKDLADKLNVSDKAVSRWETGKGFPDVDSLQTLSKFFNITINELLAGEKAETKTVEEIAEENIISAIEETVATRHKHKVNIIFSIIAITLIAIPFVITLFQNFKTLFLKYTLITDYTSFIIQSVVAVLIFLSGLVVFKGHISLLHTYHYHNVAPENKKIYCKEIGKALMLLSIPIFICTILELWATIYVIQILSSIIITTGIIIFLLLVLRIQTKYNGGIF